MFSLPPFFPGSTENDAVLRLTDLGVVHIRLVNVSVSAIHFGRDLAWAASVAGAPGSIIKRLAVMIYPGSFGKRDEAAIIFIEDREIPNLLFPILAPNRCAQLFPEIFTSGLTTDRRAAIPDGSRPTVTNPDPLGRLERFRKLHRAGMPITDSSVDFTDIICARVTRFSFVDGKPEILAPFDTLTIGESHAPPTALDAQVRSKFFSDAIGNHAVYAKSLWGTHRVLDPDMSEVVPVPGLEALVAQASLVAPIHAPAPPLVSAPASAATVTTSSSQSTYRPLGWSQPGSAFVIPDSSQLATMQAPDPRPINTVTSVGRRSRIKFVHRALLVGDCGDFGDFGD